MLAVTKGYHVCRIAVILAQEAAADFESQINVQPRVISKMRVTLSIKVSPRRFETLN